MLDKLNDLSNLSNLLVHEVDPSAGYARRSIIIDDGGPGELGSEDPAAYTEEIPMGKLVYRLNSASALDLNAPYTAFDIGNTFTEDDQDPGPGPGGEEDGDIIGLTAAYNFAVVFGDKYSTLDLWFTTGEGENDAVAFVRGEVQLKADTIWRANDITDSANKKAVKALLERQGIILLESDEAVLS